MTAVMEIGDEAETRWQISLSKGVVVIQFTPGTVVDLEVIKGVYKELISEPAKYRSTNAVWDFRGALPGQNLHYEELNKLVEHFRELRQDWWKHKKSAVVVSGKAAFGLIRMYGALMDGRLDHEMQIFENDLEAAIKWAQPQD